MSYKKLKILNAVSNFKILFTNSDGAFLMNFVSDGAVRCLMKIHSNYESKNYVSLQANLVPRFHFFLEGTVNYCSSLEFQLFEFHELFY